MVEVLKENIRQAINMTGFPLEYAVSELLKRHGWSIISNRLYIDDIKGVEREIDILAYKVSEPIDEVEYITALVISCKKSTKNIWCFLTHDINQSDPNFNFTPLHFCATDKRFEYLLENNGSELITTHLNHKALKNLYPLSHQVMTYQVLQESPNDKQKKETGNLCIKNNEGIYNSISSLIKAISYEKKSRREKYNNHLKRCYIFYALSIFDGQMVQANFKGNDKQEIMEIDSLQYLNRHIVNNIDDFFLVDFTSFKNFDYRLNLYDIVHDVNIKNLKYLIDNFYENIFDYPNRVDIFMSEFEDEVYWSSKQIILELTNKDIDKKYFHILYEYDNVERTLALDICQMYKLTDKEWDYLNTSQELKQIYKIFLRKFYKYEGEIIFKEIDPF